MRRLATFALCICAPICLSACLPSDDRPNPAEVLVTAEPSRSTTSGLMTSDGWTVTFERVLMGLGNTGFKEDDACNEYSGSEYARVFDFVVPGRNKVGLSYGLGACTLSFRISTPQLNSPLETGVTAEDVTLMRTPVADGHATPGTTVAIGAAPQPSRTSVLVRGRADRQGVTKHFDWEFRQNYRLHDCGAPDPGTNATPVTLKGGDSITLALVVHAEELLRTAAADDASFAFDPIASADADADGNVTLTELGQVMTAAAQPVDGGTEAGDAGAPTTLENLVYDSLVPRIVQLDGAGVCQRELRRGRGPGGG
jgi:hypothetical protein